jgi:sugar lactone lactonase YvrE
MKILSKLEIATASHCLLGEGPVWNQSIKSLNFIDIFGKRVYSYDPQVGRLDSFLCPQEIGAVIPSETGGFLLNLRDGIYTSTLSGSEITLAMSIESENGTNRMNDAKCDPHGRLWAGTMDEAGVKRSGALYRIDERGLVKILDNVTVSNGLGWSPDGEVMYYIDSGKQMLQAGDFDLNTGMLINLKPFVEFKSEMGTPDGLTVDQDGGVWVAFFGGGSVRRFSPEGLLTHIVNLPASQVTSCCFGGETYGQLYITTANVGLKENDSQQTHAGDLFVADTGFLGLPTSPSRFIN